MSFPYGPFDRDEEPDGLPPLIVDDDDEEYEDEDPYDYYDDPYADDDYIEYEDEEQGLGGFDDLKPFGSFNDGFGWQDNGW